MVLPQPAAPPAPPVDPPAPETRLPPPVPAAPPAGPPATLQPLNSGESNGGNNGGGGAYGRVDGHPSLDRAIKPNYPIGARRRGEEGTVILDVTVAADGSAAKTALVSSSGFPVLDRAAQRAAAQARFKPGTRDGQPVESAARLTLIFRLRDS
ncbi:MAG: energy transducer TonB [bacterium]